MTMQRYRRKSCTVCSRYESKDVVLTRWKDREWRCEKHLPKPVKIEPQEAQLSFEVEKG